MKKSILTKIRNDRDYSDRFLVSRRIVPELLDTAVIDDRSRGLKGEKEEEEIVLIKEIAYELAKVSPVLVDKINEEHNNILANLRKLNEDYEAVRRCGDLHQISEARLGLIMDVINKHPSKRPLVEFMKKIDTNALTATHNKLLTSIFFDFNPNLGYLIKQENNLNLDHVLDALNYVEISGNEPLIQFNKESELSKNQMQLFMHECKKNDGRVGEEEVALIRAYGSIMFDYNDREILAIGKEMKKEDELVEKYTENLKAIPGLRLNSDLEKRVRSRLFSFINITNKAFEDNQFTPQEEAICQRTAKYLGIRTEKGYNNIINYCKKKVIIANGNSRLSEAIASVLNKTAITPISLPLNEVVDYINQNPPMAVIVDLDKGEEALKLIIQLKDAPNFDGRLYGMKSKGVKPGNEKDMAYQYGVDMCFSTFNATFMVDYIAQDFGLKKN